MAVALVLILVPFPLMHDIRFAFRTLFRTPGFTIVAILMLALGIGANTAIFSLAYGLVLRPLPFPEQDRLLFVGEWSRQVPEMSVSYPDFLDWRSRQKSFTAIGVVRTQGFNFVGKEAPERVAGAMISHDLLNALEVRPVLGRGFVASDDRVGAERTIIISEGFWKRSFAGRESIIGDKIQLGSDIYTVIGVMPSAFQFPDAKTDVWVPLGLYGNVFRDRGSHPGLYAIARLKPGVTYDAGVADLKAIAEQLAQEYPDTNAGQSVAVQPLTEKAFGTVRTALYVLLAAAGFVLLIACANVANLQLARAHARTREFAVRAALGARRARIIRQLLAESLVLGGLGCVFGVLLASWGIDGLRALLPANVPRIGEVGLSLPVLGFAASAAFLTSVVFGLIPASRIAKQDLRGALAQSGRIGGSISGNRWRAGLVVGEFALTCVLLVGAGLMLRTLVKLYHAQPGFSVERTLTFNWVLSGSEYDQPVRRVQMIDRALERLHGLPGVTQLGTINPLPLSGDGTESTYFVEGSPLPEPGRQPSTEIFQVSDGLFEALQIPLVAGRGFNDHDSMTSPGVAIVDTEFVRRNFPGQNPIGKRFLFGDRPGPDTQWLTIVGVAAHIQNFRFGQSTREQVYRPDSQDPPRHLLTFAIRTTSDPAALANSVRATMRELSPQLPVFGIQTMDDVFAQSISTQKLTMSLLGTFAALAVLLATVGLYGVLAYQISQRRREIGLRMALGATEGSVVRLVVRNGLILALTGLVIGLAAAAGLTRGLKALLFGVSSGDPLSFAAVAVVMLAIGIIACWIPAHRASRIHPMDALRME